MRTVIDDLAAELLEAWGDRSNRAAVIEWLTQRLHVSRDTGRAFEANRTCGQRLADRISVFSGSWAFILIFLAVLVLWIVLNTVVLWRVADCVCVRLRSVAWVGSPSSTWMALDTDVFDGEEIVITLMEVIVEHCELPRYTP